MADTPNWGVELANVLRQLQVVETVVSEIRGAVTDLNDSVVGSRRSVAGSERAFNESRDAIYHAVEAALGFTSAVEQLAVWCSSSNRIEQVKTALRDSNFRFLVSLLRTAERQVEQANIKHEEYKTMYSGAVEKVTKEQNGVKWQ